MTESAAAVATEALLADDPFLRERAQVLRRTLRALPDHQLDALIEGLAREGDRMVAGRLFAAPSGGGCAVGVMLRALDGERYEGSRLRFLLAHGWRRTVRSYTGELGSSPRLRHLEWIFDAAVERVRALRPAVRGDAARLIGRWFLREACRERDWRELEASFAADQAAVGEGAAGRALA